MAAHSSKLTEILSIPFHGLIDTFFPPLCPLCRGKSQKNSFCANCEASFRKVLSPFCTICGIPFGASSGSDHRCGTCIKETPPFDRAASLFHYDDKIKSAIRDLKYSGKTFIASMLAPLMAAHELAADNYDFIVPVPLHISRLRERGFNQSMLIAVNAGRHLNMQVNPYILERKKPTLPQAGMKSKERRLNLKGAFSMRAENLVKGKSCLLIDDVYTTGATAIECAKALKKGGAAKVNVLTVARVAL